MNKKRPYIVITRPEPGLSETAQRISQLGWQPLLMPVMRLQSLHVNPMKMDNVQAIVFTSRQAIMPLVKQLSVQNIDYKKIPVFTVGNITAMDAENAGFCNVISADKDAVALAFLLKNTLDPKKGALLFPSAKGQGQLLLALLKQAAFRVLHLEVYEAKPVSDLSDVFVNALSEEKINSILFFSSETARYFIELLPDNLHERLNSIQAIGISVKTKKILEHIFWRSLDNATYPKTEEMLCLIKEHF